MTKQEILDAINANPGKELYVRCSIGSVRGFPDLGWFDRTNKTRLLRNAQEIASVETGTYRSFRPDLERYFDPFRPSALAELALCL